MRIILFLLIIGCSANAEVAVQRSTTSSFQEYRNYLKTTGRQSFANAYLNNSLKIEVDTKEIQSCLEQLYLNRQSEEVCQKAFLSQTELPLNHQRRQLLISLLKKMKNINSKYAQLYADFLTGLQQNHSQSDINSTKTKQNAILTQVQVKAWKKIMQRKVLLSESHLLINGVPITNLDHWSAPPGVYQWSLISNTHEPLTLISSFDQFANWSVQKLKAFSHQNCDRSEEIKSFGVTQVSFFFNRKCIIEKNWFMEDRTYSEISHVNDPFSKTKLISPQSKKHWVFPVLLVSSLIIANQLKGKSISIQVPGIAP